MWVVDYTKKGVLLVQKCLLENFTLIAHPSQVFACAYTQIGPTVGIWILNICITDNTEYRTFKSLVFASVIQMPRSYYLPGKKIVDKLPTIQFTILILD